MPTFIFSFFPHFFIFSDSPCGRQRERRQAIRLSERGVAAGGDGYGGAQAGDEAGRGRVRARAQRAAVGQGVGGERRGAPCLPTAGPLRAMVPSSPPPPPLSALSGAAIFNPPTPRPPRPRSRPAPALHHLPCHAPFLLHNYRADGVELANPKP
jgi:hypothetical protein